MLRFISLIFLCISTYAFAEAKEELNVAYGKDERNVMDIFWDSDFKDAPIVFAIHGGGFRAGSKKYCGNNIKQFYKAKGCIVVAPNYRLINSENKLNPNDCALDVAMGVAWMQENAKKFGGNPKRIVATGASAGGYISHHIAYNKKWNWPKDAQYKPEKLNIVGWFGNSPGVSEWHIKQINNNMVPAFMIYGGKEHPKTPASLGHRLRKLYDEHKVWNKMVYAEHRNHCPGKYIIYNKSTRDQASADAYSAFIDMVCYDKGKPQSGGVILAKAK